MAAEYQSRCGRHERRRIRPPYVALNWMIYT